MSGCKPAHFNAPRPGASLRQPPEERKPDDRRLIFAQIVEDSNPEFHSESAILEGAPFKHLLRSLVNVNHDELRRRTSEELTFDQLMAQPGMCRGQVVTLARGVVLEVSSAVLPPEYGLPLGYTVLPAVFVDAAYDVYALRILCPPGSKLFEKLAKGIETDALPVLRMSGIFMKLYARRTAEPKEPPWRRPLLICPEPEFSHAAQPRKVWADMEKNDALRFLPSERLDAPGAEERLVIELLPGRGSTPRVRSGGREAGSDMAAFIAERAAALRKRLPREQAENPAAVVLIASGAPRKQLDAILAALRAAGIKRLAVKSEL